MTGRDDDRLRQLLEDLERSAPMTPVPPLPAPRRRGALLWLPLGGAVVAAGIVAGVLIAGPLSNRDVATAPSGSLSAVPTAATPTELATPTPAGETATPTATPSPTPAPREGWTASPVVEPGRYVGIYGVAEIRGMLVAHGSSEGNAAGVWLSTDGRTWEQVTAVPQPPDGQLAQPPGPLGASITDVIDGGERLVAVAPMAIAEGGEAYATAIYVSSDGREWVPADQTPGVEGHVMSSLAKVGDRIVAVGQTGVWLSDDGGLTWRESAASASLGGSMARVVESDGMLLAAGWEGETHGPKTPVLWRSSDAGDSWTRTELGGSGQAQGAAIAADGTMLVVGIAEQESTAWRSADGGDTWSLTVIGGCCIDDVAATPTGFVATSLPSAVAGGPAGGALASRDGTSWTPVEDIGIAEPEDVDWGDTFGLLAAGDETVALGPVPHP